MTDVVDRETRSRMMSGIRGKNTKPELAIRKALFSAGYRFRLHPKSLPGKPDLYLRKYQAAIFVHGCFWHGHGCHLFKWPQSNRAFWKQKIVRNRAVDRSNEIALQQRALRLAVIWECALKGRASIPLDNLAVRLDRWLQGSRSRITITGTLARPPYKRASHRRK